MRFAQVTLSKVGTEDATPLVTDARGRMRYRLPAGEYRLSLASGPHTQFAVHDRRWTTVRLQLTQPNSRPDADRPAGPASGGAGSMEA
jgi:hypothetical protein